MFKRKFEELEVGDEVKWQIHTVKVYAIQQKIYAYGTIVSIMNNTAMVRVDVDSNWYLNGSSYANVSLSNLIKV